MCILNQLLVEPALAERDSKKCRRFFFQFFFVGGHLLGGDVPGVPRRDRGNWGQES